jgi:hypothetical protein
MNSRRCSQPVCSREAVATVTIDYDDRTMALGPLAPAETAEGYHLCNVHARRLTPAYGWRLIRHLELSGDV